MKINTSSPSQQYELSNKPLIHFTTYLDESHITRVIKQF